MGIKYNIISGVFAALAAVCTKVGFNFNDGLISTLFLPTITNSIGVQDLTIFKYILHVIFIVLMLLSNALMLRFYVSSL